MPSRTASAPAFKRGKQQHPAQHGQYEQGDLPVTTEQDCNGRSGADPGDAPANAEQQATGDKSPVELAPARELHRSIEQGTLALLCPAEGQQRRTNRPDHHQHQGRIPRTRKIQEANHLRRVGHTGKQQTKTEAKAGNE